MTRRLAGAQLSNSIGDGGFIVVSALYFTQVVGLSATRVGLALTLAWGVGAVAGVALGHLADRWGPRTTAVVLAGATAASIGVLLLTRGFIAFVLVMCVYASCQSGLQAARQALLAGLTTPLERTRARARIQSTANAGIAIGAAAGGVALHIGTEAAYTAVFVLDVVSFLVAAAILATLPETVMTKAAGRFDVLKDRPYALVTLVNAVMLLYMPLLSLIIPLWIVQRTAAPTWLAAALLVLNTAAVVLFQVRIAGRVTGLGSASKLVANAGLVMLASCVVFAVTAASFGAWSAAVLLVVAAALQVLGEMMLASGAWEIGFALAPADRQGQYQGFFATGTAVARMVGPALLTTVVLGWGAVGWLLVGGLFVVAGYAMGPAVRWAREKNSTSSGAMTEDLTTCV
ncbi:Major Facilitator Superfamily protein [Lentzea fradiae]|uniref:Major Facilitator Superfamily protein n=1 Tax=Lentzea fradiae TaxID=200378 RepID=A0A1G7QBM2_9PSEU|nr:MFS transporter [Lentzea fradiae]SDF95932.1 Major Facilitator Superfamily protein [Lentzea fradiae]